MTLQINQAGCGVLSLPGTQHSSMKMQEGSKQKKMPLRGQTLKMRRLEERISFRKCRSGAELEMHRHADALRQGGGGTLITRRHLFNLLLGAQQPITLLPQHPLTDLSPKHTPSVGNLPSQLQFKRKKHMNGEGGGAQALAAATCTLTNTVHFVPKSRFPFVSAVLA